MSVMRKEIDVGCPLPLFLLLRRVNGTEKMLSKYLLNKIISFILSVILHYKGNAKIHLKI